MTELPECLPAEYRGAGTAITRIAAGLSGAGVYRVEGGGPTLVLKVAGDAEPIADWLHRLAIHEAAAAAGVAPRIVHVDASQRAVVSEFVVDRSFLALFRDPGTHDRAVELLGDMLRRVHGLPLPRDAVPADGRALLAAIETRFGAGGGAPAFVRDAMRRLLAEDAPARDRPPVRSHNDVNPSNLAYDGERLLLLDWDAAGVNDPSYDLATIAMFLRMDEPTCLALLSAHDGAPVSELPRRFIYNRRLTGMMCGALGVDTALRRGHPPATGADSIDSTMSLLEFYQAMRAGTVNLATPEGQWAFGLALVKESI